jgi:hypothetical protein
VPPKVAHPPPLPPNAHSFLSPAPADDDEDDEPPPGGGIGARGGGGAPGGALDGDLGHIRVQSPHKTAPRRGVGEADVGVEQGRVGVAAVADVGARRGTGKGGQDAGRKENVGGFAMFKQSLSILTQDLSQDLSLLRPKARGAEGVGWGLDGGGGLEEEDNLL